MNRRTLLLNGLGAAAALATPPSAPQQASASNFVLLPGGNIMLSWDFTYGTQGWLPGFSDYTLGMDLDATAEVRAIPTGQPGTGISGYYFNSRNASDDLFMYLRRPVGPESGIKPTQKYIAHVHVQLYSKAPSDCAGAGGAPGEAVILKAGVTSEEPATTLLGRYVSLNLDKGDQSVGGTDLRVLGNIANGDPCQLPVPETYRLITRVLYQPVPVTSSPSGRLWITVGTDSGYEGITSLFYWTIGVVLIPV